ncbi:MAG: hypothetical protein NT051_02010 [Candidatus Micrarchaeota archaeon]|nr:hypothetical protein [Candidatus Micrarchaeota archaeon]
MKKTWIAIAGCFALLLLSFGCIAQPGGGAQAGSGWAAGWGWEAMVGLACAAVLFLLALGYMAASLLMDDKMKAWVSKEVGQVFYSVLIILVVIAGIGAMNEALRILIINTGTTGWQNYTSQSVCCVPPLDPNVPSCLRLPTRPCHFEVAFDYLQLMYESLRSNLLSYFVNHYFNYFLSNLNIGASLRLLIHLGGASVRPLAGLAMGSDFFSILFDTAIKNMMLVRLQQIFIDFFLAGFFPIMLSIGLVLRIFYFTRKLGGTLIALSLCIYFVLPMFYVLSSSIFFHFVGGWDPGARSVNIGMSYNQTDPNNRLPFAQNGFQFESSNYTRYDASNETLNVMDVCGTSSQTETEASTGPLTTFKGAWKSVQGGGWYQTLKSFFTTTAFSKEGPIATLAAIMVFTLLIPFLGIMTTLAAYKVISPMIGGDVEIALLSRLI